MREPLVSDSEPDSDTFALRAKASKQMKEAVDAEGARVARAKRKADRGSGFVPHAAGGEIVEADGSVKAMSRSRKDSTVFYADEALREAVEDRPDVFQHPPIEDSDELVLWLSIAEAQAKVERRQRELDGQVLREHRALMRSRRPASTSRAVGAGAGTLARSLLGSDVAGSGSSSDVV